MTNAVTNAQMVRVADIKVDKTHNPRKRFDDAAQAELTDSVKQRGGVVQSVTVFANDDGSYTLVAGERRLRAARAANVDEIPAVIRPRESALLDALTENLVRADLDPIEEAEGLQRLAQIENLNTHKTIAKRLGGVSPDWVGDRLRLLNLPEAVQMHVAAGTVPLAAERDLRVVSEVAPAIAERVCELVASGDIDKRDLVDSFGDVLVHVSMSKLPRPLVMIHMRDRMRLSELMPAGKKRDALVARLQVTTDDYGYPIRSADPTVRVGEHLHDAARASGKLIEHTEKTSRADITRAFLVDAPLAADLADRMVEDAEKKHAEREARRSQTAGDGDSSESQKRKEAYAKRQADAKKARTRNGGIASRLLAGRVTKVRRERALERARAAAEMIVSNHPNLPARGLRLVLPELQEEKVRTLKKGGVQRKVVYAEFEDCAAYVRERIAKAKSADEVLELMAEMLVSAALTDDDELPKSRRVFNRDGRVDHAVKHLTTDMKAAMPPQARRKRA